MADPIEILENALRRARTTLSQPLKELFLALRHAAELDIGS